MGQEDNIQVALIGNPNCGKTSLFNALTGMNQRVGNFPGVTVDKKTGITHVDGKTLSIIDLPGTYSLYPKSPDEEVVQNVLLDKSDEEYPDLCVLVLDASNLKRNLYLATQVMDLGLPVIVALNMMDVAGYKNMEINAKELSLQLDVPVLVTNAKTGVGVDTLIRSIAESKARVSTGFTQASEESKEIVEVTKRFFPDFEDYKAYRIALNAQELDWVGDKAKHDIKEVLDRLNFSKSKAQLKEIGERYEKINALFPKFCKLPNEEKSEGIQEKIDKVVTHKVWGIVLFLLVFFLLFQSVFTLAEYPMNWIDSGMGMFTAWLTNTLPDTTWANFITDGIVAGLAGVVVFLPQIMILFGLVTILEDSGYMARVSFLNDKLLEKTGMNGKSIVPLVGGFACAVPAIMAARSIQNPRERLITIMITPLMSCSARLPVYVFLIAFIVPDDKLWGFVNLQGLFMLGLYILGIVMSVAVAAFMNRFLTKGAQGSFILELPSYKVPRWKNVFSSMLNKGKAFVIEAGKIILLVSILLWFLASFGPGDRFANIEQKYQSEELQSLHSESELSILEQSEKLENSYAGMLGKFIEPAIRPLGFDWKTGIALITSFAAREVFVGTMSTIYSVQGGDEEDTIAALQEKLKNAKDPKTGLPVFTLATAFSLLIFYVFALQCMGTVAIVKRETGTWKWATIQFFLFTAMAYLGSFITYQLLS